MPSSHGGGFGGGGGGGSFGGGFHSSGGSGGGQPRGPRVSNRPFPGARRYSYINSRGMMVFFYSDTVPRKTSLRSTILLYGGLIIFFVVLAVFLITAAVPKKMSKIYINPTSSYYEDNAGIVTKTDDLNAEFNSFYELTGVQPYLYTINAENFPKQYGSITKYSLEDFAYDLYLDLFNDEGHWLIVFVKYDDEPYFVWIDMAGDNTQNLINDSFFNRFQRDMQHYLNHATLSNSNMDYCDAIVTSFKYSEEYVLDMNEEARGQIIMYVVIFGGLVALMAYVLIKSIQQALRINGYVNFTKNHPEGIIQDNEIKDTPYEYVSADTYTPPQDEDPFR